MNEFQALRHAIEVLSASKTTIDREAVRVLKGLHAFTQPLWMQALRERNQNKLAAAGISPEEFLGILQSCGPQEKTPEEQRAMMAGLQRITDALNAGDDKGS